MKNFLLATAVFVSRRLESPRSSFMNKSNNLEKGYLKVLVYCIYRILQRILLFGHFRKLSEDNFNTI